MHPAPKQNVPALLGHENKKQLNKTSKEAIALGFINKKTHNTYETPRLHNSSSSRKAAAGKGRLLYERGLRKHARIRKNDKKYLS